MKKIEIVRNPPPERKVVAYQYRYPSGVGGNVYVPGGGERGGCYHPTSGRFTKITYEENLFTGTEVVDCYTPLYEGDQIVISEVITL